MIESRRMRLAGYVVRIGEKRKAYRILVGKPEGDRSLQRPRRRWVDNIEIDFTEIGWDGRALVNTVMNLRIPKNAGKFLKIRTIGNISRGAQLLH
jgi:hypothetical protein